MCHYVYSLLSSSRYQMCHYVCSLFRRSGHQMHIYMFSLCSCSIHQMYISRYLSWPVLFSAMHLETCSKCMCLNCSEFLDTRCRKITKGKSQAANRVSNCKPSKTRHYNDQKKKNKSTNKELQNTTQKPKDRATRTPLKHGVHQCA